jgi:hypothetical protein
MSEALRLHPDTVRELAAAIADELREPLPMGNKPLTVAEVASLLGCSADFVRSHRAELGVLPAKGTKPRLLFDAARVRAFMQAPGEVRNGITQTKPKSHTRRRRRSTPNLLPIREPAHEY